MAKVHPPAAVARVWRTDPRLRPNPRVDWQAVADAALAVVECAACNRFATGGCPQPFWVGPGFVPGNPVLLLQNPGCSPLEKEAEDYLTTFRQRRPASVEAFLDWSLWRCADTTATWKQWPPLAYALDGLFAPHEVAWLNVSPFPTARDKDPSQLPDPEAPRPWRRRFPTQADHGRNLHLQPLLLEVLHPGTIVTRFKNTQVELDVLQDWLVDQGVSLPWSTTPTMNVPNVIRRWDRDSASEVAAALAARYPARAAPRERRRS